MKRARCIVPARPAASLAVLSVLIAGCTGEPAAPPPAPPPAEVTVIMTEAKDTPIVFEFVGKTASSRRVEVRARVDGFLEERLYEEGTLVNEGDLLFRMDRKPLEAKLHAAQAELQQQEARVDTAQANYDRIKPLVEQNAVAQKDLDDAIGTLRTAQAAVEAANAKVVQAELDLGYTEIKAPVTGLSSFAVQQEGAYLGFGVDSLLTYVAQLEPMWVEFSISENQMLHARSEGERGRVEVPGEGDFEVEVVLADGTVYPHTGRITFADAALSEETGTFLLRAEVANPETSLRPGQFVRVHLKGAYRPGAILVPQRAVQQGAKGSYVWVVDQGKAKFQPIEVGPWHEDQWFVDTGLQSGQIVVVDGAARLQNDAPVTIVTIGAKSGDEQAAAGTTDDSR